MLTWNVEGLTSKLRHSDFIKFIQDFDIICLTETWLQSTEENIFTLTGFDCFLGPGIKHEGKNRGRMAGGVLLGWKAEEFEIIKLKKNTNFTRWIGIIKNGSVVLCIGVVYIQPSDSVYFKDEFFEMLTEEIGEIDEKYYGAGKILMGDLNARIGEEDCTGGRGDDWLPNRKSKDKSINSSGRKLLQLMESTGMIIANGRVKGDESGEYTFLNSNGGSVVDVILTDRGIFSNIDKVEVKERLESQHLPVSVDIFIPDFQKNSFSNVVKSEYKRIRWSEKKIDVDIFKKGISDKGADLILTDRGIFF